MITAKLKKRGVDKWGSGEFGASRGDRTHNGIDYCVAICSPVKGEVTKLGYCYSNDLSYRYVQVTDSAHRDHRIFYIDPLVKVGDMVEPGDFIGTPQTLQTRYPGITDHCHYEIKQGSEYLNPDEFHFMPAYKEADKG